MSVVIVFFIVAVSATLFMILVSWNAETGEGIARDGVRAKWHADACAEHALHELRNVPGYAGSQSLSFDDGGCAIPPFTASASFSLNAEGESGGAFARVLVSGLLSVNASGEVTAVQVLSREYVADF